MKQQLRPDCLRHVQTWALKAREEEYPDSAILVTPAAAWQNRLPLAPWRSPARSGSVVLGLWQAPRRRHPLQQGRGVALSRTSSGELDAGDDLTLRRASHETGVRH